MSVGTFLLCIIGTSLAAALGGKLHDGDGELHVLAFVHLKYIFRALWRSMRAMQDRCFTKCRVPNGSCQVDKFDVASISEPWL
jgi:hypothetical protein